jgi:hypothetical protein
LRTATCCPVHVWQAAGRQSAWKSDVQRVKKKQRRVQGNSAKERRVRIGATMRASSCFAQQKERDIIVRMFVRHVSSHGHTCSPVRLTQCAKEEGSAASVCGTYAPLLSRPHVLPKESAPCMARKIDPCANACHKHTPHHTARRNSTIQPSQLKCALPRAAGGRYACTPRASTPSSRRPLSRYAAALRGPPP